MFAGAVCVAFAVGIWVVYGFLSTAVPDVPQALSLVAGFLGLALFAFAVVAQMKRD